MQTLSSTPLDTCCTYIGTYTQEEIWPVMVPRAFVEEYAMEDNGDVLEWHCEIQ